MDPIPEKIEMVRPFIKGIERNSVLIDVTDVKDTQLLRQSLQDFNLDAEKGKASYIGRLASVQKYLKRSFMETMWTLGSQGHHTILNEGITLSDGSFIKGSRSLPAESRIVKVILERLPFLQPEDLMINMDKRLSIFWGILWNDYDQEEILVYLQYDNMPDFCRLCQASDHCRADCKEAKRFLKCYNCNQHGHIMRNCPRNNVLEENNNNKFRAVTVKKERRKPKAKADNDTALDTPIPVISTATNVQLEPEQKTQISQCKMQSHR
ncbi:uncharacterized protein EV154DRAFT_554382 [Mucor mucedo]|uniref:uncharacterized protein n=1 Tax=Mucor mucedo TaxID=29922 RepID=UPI00221FBFEA|nr:uncharacterized protein EV154DRAFT_554382 [Mucor mucedo]KAI7887776.1 hypothetical protein EV154DRAFT_554382 [Mucor mucedo]